MNKCKWLIVTSTYNINNSHKYFFYEHIHKTIEAKFLRGDRSHQKWSFDQHRKSSFPFPAKRRPNRLSGRVLR